MAAKSNEMAPKFDYNEESNSDGSEKSKGKLGDYNKKMKSVASTGFEKAKSAASTGAKKAKEGTSAGVRWIKIQYNKNKKHGSGQD